MESKTGDLEGLAGSTAKAIQKGEADIKPEPKDPAPATAIADVPDPDEDDLDDLDDMLDEFTAPKPSSKTAAPVPAVPESQIPAVEDGLSDEDFAKQLQAGMADLLGDLESNPDMQAQFENMLKELGGGGSLEAAAGLGAASAFSSAQAKAKAPPSTTSKTPEPSSATEETFQETIKKTMERMQSSGDQATAAAASSNSEEDLMAEMMKAMQASGLGGGEGGEGSEEDFSKMLLGMMEQLTNKEILYEPMKELHDKYPEWVVRNEGKVEEADMKRYKEQQVFVKEIVDRFEAKGYSDDNAADREYIVERMQKMQAAGSPPPDLVGDMAAAQEAFGAPEEGCPQQ